jgi:ribose 5-phosphate isomerase A
MTSEQLKQAAAEAAVALVEPGMRVGLGTGSTAARFVAALGTRIKAGLDIVCVPTSEATRAQAESLGYRLTTLDEAPELDLTIDGADEVDGRLNLIKGGGAALLREKIVAAASRRMVVIADISKQVRTLGTFPLPIEVNAFGLGATRRAIAAILGESVPLKLRETAGGQPLITDGGHLILDARVGIISDAESLGIRLNGVPGVVEHGLFVGLCDTALIASESGVAVVTRTA